MKNIKRFLAASLILLALAGSVHGFGLGLGNGFGKLSAQISASVLLPCDIAGNAGTPCVAAHSVTRRMWSGYQGPLFQLQRASDNATQNIGFLANNQVNQAAINSFCAGTTCNFSILYDQIHTAASGNNLPAPGDFANQPPVTYTTFSNGAALPMVATIPGQFLRNRTATVGIPSGNSPITEYMVQNNFTWSQCCGTYGEMEATVSDTGQGHMFALGFENNVGGVQPGNGNGPWPTIDWENGVFSFGDPPTTVLLSTFGRYSAAGNVYSLKSDPGLTGTLSLLHNGPPPATAAFEGGISLGEGGDGTPAPTAFFEGIIIAAATSDATDNAIEANVAAFYNGIGATPLQPAQIQTTVINVHGGPAGGTSWSPTVPVPAGSLIVMFAEEDTTTPQNATITDTQGNSYILAARQCAGLVNGSAGCTTNSNNLMFFAFNAKALSTSDTVTFTPSSGGTFSALGGFYATGILATSNPLDVTNTAFGASGNSVVSATPTASADLFVVLTFSSSGQNPQGWNTPITGSIMNNDVGTPATIRNPGTGQLTYTSPDTSTNWGAIIAGFKHQ